MKKAFFNILLIVAVTVTAIAFTSCQKKQSDKKENVAEVENVGENTEAADKASVDSLDSTVGKVDEPYEYEGGDDNDGDGDGYEEEITDGAFDETVTSKLPEAGSKQLGDAARFASEAFVFLSFPFYGSYSWIETRSIDYFIDNTDYYDKQGDGEAFKVIFKQIYNQRDKKLDGWLDDYVKLIAPLIPVKKYRANGWDAIVSQLLVAYDDLSSRQNAFAKVYDVMADVEYGEYGETHRRYGNASAAYESIRPFVSDENLGAFFVTKKDVGYWSAGEINQSAVVWAYSFWGRRFHENPDNIKPIAATLRLLRDKLFAFKVS